MKYLYKILIMKVFIKTLIICLFISVNTSAEEIGVIGFVIGNAYNQDGKKLNVGDPIFFGDTVNTDEDSKSQILFIDQTVMTVGSKTELTIDEFVFDAENTDGKLLSTIKAGSIKILTGKISEKNPENLVVETPAGTIGSRGTEFKAAVDPETSKSKILLIGPGPKNSLGLRPGAVEVSNASGSVILDKPYLFTEVNQNTAPRQPVIVPQIELQKFQELEVEPDAPVTENQDENKETQLAENNQEEIDEIKAIVKGEIFGENEDLGDLVLDTLVTALSKDDGGITAQLLGKSFINSGGIIPRALIPDDVKDQLPEGIDINSPEADAFFAGELQNEIEKVMLVSARVEDVDFVPTEFNQFNAGFGDIKVPIFNDETGDVVFLEMGDIDFKPQFGNLPQGNFDFGETVLPEQLILKGQDSIAIDLEKGQFFEQEIDPQMEALNQRFEAAIDSGASSQELDQIVFEMDNVMFEANQIAQTFEVAAIQNQFGNDFKFNAFSNEEFTQVRESFIFDTNEYSQNWKEAVDQGLTPIFQLDGSVTLVEKDQAELAWQEIDQQYEQQFSEQFPEIFQAEKKAEELSLKADQEANILYSKIDEAIESGASEDEINKLYEDVDTQLNEIYTEVDQAYEQVALAQIKTEVIEIGANEIIAESNKEDPKVDEELEFERAIDLYVEELNYSTQIPIDIPIINQSESYAIGTTSYADLNTKSSGTETFTGSRTNLYVDRVANGDAEVGDVAGSFTPSHSINYSTRTINQSLSASVKIGSVTTERSFTIDKDHTYTSSTTGNVTPAFVVRKSANNSNNKRLDDSLTGDISKTLPATGYADRENAHFYVTLESNFNNLSEKSFADSVETTLTVQTGDENSSNQVSGTTTSGRD